VESGTERSVTTAARAAPAADPWLERESALVALARSGGPLRAAIALAAARLVEVRAPEKLGYARLADYARERLGQAGRTVYEWAQVGAALARAPRLAQALASGEAPWTKARALARLASVDEIEAWLPLAAKHTAASLDREVRRIAHCAESLCDDDHEPREPVALAVTPRVRGKWHYAQSLGRQTAGFHASPAVVAEMIAAEVLSALETDESFRAGDPEDARLALRAEAGAQEWTGAAESQADPAQWLASDDGARSTDRAALERLADGLDTADAHELDRRLRDWIGREQRLDAEIGARLSPLARRHAYRALGFPSLDAYARERLGLDPAKARALLRLERTVANAPELGRAYRSGTLSWGRGARARARDPGRLARPLRRRVGRPRGGGHRAPAPRRRGACPPRLRGRPRAVVAHGRPPGATGHRKRPAGNRRTRGERCGRRGGGGRGRSGNRRI
jgi:hypothetical protein